MDAPDTGVLTWRPLAADDAALLEPLVSAIGRHDGAAETFTVDDLADELGTPWLDRAADTVLGLDAAGTALAFGTVELRPGDSTSLRVTCWGGVHPQARRRGVGRALLAWQERRGRALVAARCSELGSRPPARVSLRVEEKAVDAARLAQRRGFAAVRWFTVMRRPLELALLALPALQVPAGLRLVPWSIALDEPIRLAHNEAFLDHWGFQPWTVQSWAQWGSGHRNFRGDWSYALLDGDQVAGYATSAAYEQDWPALGFSEGWTAKLGVRRPWRGRGLAKALLAASMRAFADAGMTSAGLDVDSENPSGAVGLYQGLGYRPAHRTATWSLTV